MKLPIKKEFFNMIKLGKKRFEYRDAHITFVCEGTGEQLRKEVKGVDIIPIDIFKDSKRREQVDMSLFDDKLLIEFELR